MKTPLLRALPALLGLLAACGGGSAPPADAGGGLPPGTSTTQFLVDLEDDTELDEIAQEKGVTVVGQVPGTDYYILEIEAGQDIEEVLEELGDDVRVVDASPDLGLGSPEGEGSTIPFLGAELPLQVRLQPELVRIGAAQAHERTLGAGSRVAVLDTGVVATHELLLERVDLASGWDYVGGDPDPAEAPNGLDDDRDGRIDEGYGHGTFVASLVLAVAPDATIVPFRVLDSDAVGNASNLAAAISAAVDAGVDVINLSVGMPTEVKVVQQAVRRARESGIVVVAAAGNTGTNAVRFPAALSDGFSVTSVNGSDIRPAFASFGSDVDLCAPGVDLLGAFPGGNGTARWSGTSFSAAIVSGAHALVRTLFPEGDVGSRSQQLRDTSVDVDPLNPLYAGRLGEGRLDLAAATAP